VKKKRKVRIVEAEPKMKRGTEIVKANGGFWKKWVSRGRRGGVACRSSTSAWKRRWASSSSMSWLAPLLSTKQKIQVDLGRTEQLTRS
jgi:hypothetical protein